MKFSAQISDLKRILPYISAVIPSRSPLSQLENIQFELKSKRLTLMGTDLEISVRSTIEVNAKTDGVIALESRRLGEFIRSLPDGEISFSLDKSTRRVALQTALGKSSMTASDAGDLPDLMKEFSPEGSTTVVGSALKNMISTAIFAVSSNEFRASMTGLLFQFSPDGTTTVATDGHRLVRITDPSLKTDSERDVIVPAKAVNLVLKSFGDTDEITIRYASNLIEFANENTSILSRLIDEQYPNYEAVIPRENEKVMTIARSALHSSVKRVMIFADNDTKQIRLQLTKDQITINADNADEGVESSEVITCDYPHDDLLIGFNGRFLDDALSHLDCDEVIIKFSTPTRAAIIEPVPQGAQDVLMLVMPVRLSS
jgi:DNA polymerase-3 subunit beta